VYEDVMRLTRTWVTEPFPKWGSTSARQNTMVHFCGFSWQLWRYKCWTWRH